MTDQQTKPLIQRTTALTDAFMAAAGNAGLDTSNVRLPLKREPAWTVTRRDKTDRKRGRR